MIETSAYRLLKNLSSKYPIVLLNGPRGCFATSFARHLMGGKSYINLEDETSFALASQSPKTFLLAFTDGAVFDSVQRLPSIVDAMSYHVGRWGFVPGKFIAISNSMLEPDSQNGRIALCNIAGLTVDDLALMKRPVANPFKLMHTGQLPDVTEGKTDSKAMVEDILSKDIRKHINASNLDMFRVFMRNCACSSAQRLSLNMVAKQTGISAPTAKVWLSVLQRNLVVRLVQEKNNDSHFSTFFTDTGILCSLLGIESAESLILSPHRERVTKTFVFNELLRGRFYKNLDQNLFIGHQTDFHATWNGGFEILVDPNIEVTEAKMEQVLQAKKNTGMKAVVVHLGDVTYTKDGIDCISFRDLTKLAMEIDYFS